MKILLAGAFGNLGIEILKVLCEGGHEVIAADLKEKENNGLEGKYTFRAIGQYAGVTNAILKYQTIDNKWHNIPVRFVTDKGLNVTGKQTAKEYITNSRY